MFTGSEIVLMLGDMGITHVVWIPDSTLGPWETALRDSDIELIIVCREGEAWTVAAGLYVGGASPLVMIQCTGFFESGDALRNVLWDFKLPIYAFIGYRSYLSQSSLPGDTARRFTEPLLKAWELDYRLIERADQRNEVVQHYRDCRAADRAGIAVIAEGKA
ncbi:MAG: hypothetical protein O3A00_22420 [Planctomycetota bacterium]|nr:hypothetical protein [Planctomycetota bacterium]